jgi:hypothetical protein
VLIFLKSHRIHSPKGQMAFAERSVMTLAIQNLITNRCGELRLGRAELVRRCGYKNISKGIRRLEQVYAGELQKGISLLRGLPSALELTPEVVRQAVDETLGELNDRALRSAAEADAAWRAAFKPHAYLLGTRTRPSQLLFFAITGGAERWLKIPLDLSQPPLSYATQALAVVRRTPFVQYFGATTGFIVNYTPDHAVRFDLESNPVETFTRAYRPMEVTVSLGRREVSAESFGRVLGTIPRDEN